MTDAPSPTCWCLRPMTFVNGRWWCPYCGDTLPLIPPAPAPQSGEIAPDPLTEQVREMVRENPEITPEEIMHALRIGYRRVMKLMEDVKNG